jgi:alpha-tubulin suppressor-like RCC1 family protein
VAGATINPAITVAVLDAFDNPVTAGAPPVTLAITPATAFGGAVLAGTTTAAPANGVATFNVSIARAGTGYALRATATALTEVVSATFDIGPAAAAALSVTQAPGNVAAMDVLTPTPMVTIRDAYENTVTSATTAVSLELFPPTNPDGAVIRGTTTANAVNGVATFPDLRFDRPSSGSFVLRATAVGLPAVVATSSSTIELKTDTVVTGGYVDGGHTCAIGLNDFAFCWGSNEFGQLGDGSTVSRRIPAAVAGGVTFAAISAGSRHSCALTAAGAAYCWGDNTSGQLGDNTTTRRESAVAVSGSLVFESISAGDSHTCAVVKGANGGPAYCWGRNSNGQLGDGTTDEKHLPTAVSGGLTIARISADSSHTCAVIIRNGQEGVCWGDNSLGQLGDASNTQRTSPTDIAGARQWTFIVTGARHTCGTSSSALYCWGSNSNGQMGNGNAGQTTNTPTLVSGIDAFWITSGWNYMCLSGSLPNAQTSQLFCWGQNDFGQLGDGSTTDRNNPTQAGLNLFRHDASRSHTCAQNAYNEIFCWGRNTQGQLGDGTQTDRLTPTKVLRSSIALP